MSTERPSLLRRCRRFVLARRDSWSNASGLQRMGVVLVALTVVATLTLLGLAIRHDVKNWEYQRAAHVGLPLTAGALRHALDSHTLAEVDLYLMDADSPAHVSIYALTFKDGSRGWLESAWLSDAMLKDLTAAGLTQNVAFHHRGAVVANPYWGVVGFIAFLIGLGVVLFWVQRMVGRQEAGFRFDAKGKDFDITFDSIIGYPEVKRELMEILAQVRGAATYADHALSPPKGLLLAGPPGVGKTLFAKALANVSDMNFLYITGADFAQMWVGVGAARVRDLFTRARKAKRCIIFIDEIDAIGSRQTMGHDTERRSVINRLLAEMDGMDTSGQILVIGATNHAEDLDPALRRSGRFGKEVAIGLPDWTTRQAMIQHHLASMRFDADVDVAALTSRSGGFSGADIRAWMDDAKKLALRENAHTPLVTQAHFNRAHEILLLGLCENKPSETERKRVAYHEMGHALVGHVLCPHRVMDTITIQGRGQALGFTLHRPLDDRKLHTRADMEGSLAMLMGGRVAETMFFEEPSDGAGGDLKEASRLAKHMVLDLGMGETLGLVSDSGGQSLGDAMMRLALADIQALLNRAEQRARDTLSQHRDWLVEQSESLARCGTLNGSEVFQSLLQDA